MSDLGKTKIGTPDQESSAKHSQKIKCFQRWLVSIFLKNLQKTEQHGLPNVTVLWQMWGKPTKNFRLKDIINVTIRQRFKNETDCFFLKDLQKTEWHNSINGTIFYDDVGKNNIGMLD